MKQAAVLRCKNYKEWRAGTTSESNQYISDEAWQERYTSQSLNWAARLEEYLKEIEPGLQDKPLTDSFFDLRNANAIKVLTAYVARRPARDNLAGLARLYHDAPAAIRQEIKQVFRDSLSLEASLSLLAASKSKEAGPKELLHALVQDAFNCQDISFADQAKILPYLELKEQVALLKQYANQPERVSGLYQQFRKNRHETTCFIAAAPALSPDERETLAKGLRLSRRYIEQLQPLVSTDAWEALLETKSLKANHKIEILKLLGDRIQVKENVIRDLLQAEPRVALSAAMLANKYLPQLLISRRDLMHRFAADFCQEKLKIDNTSLDLLATLSKTGILREQDLSQQQKEALLKLARVAKSQPIIIHLLKALLNHTSEEANISPFLIRLSQQLLKPGGEQVINDVWLPYIPSLPEPQIKTLIAEFPGTELAKALAEELIRRNLSDKGCPPAGALWQTLDINTTAGLAQEAFLKIVAVAVNLTCTLNELAYRHVPTQDWLQQLPAEHQAIFSSLLATPLKDLSGKFEDLCRNGKERMNREWERIWCEINTFAREVEAGQQAVNEADEATRYLRRYLQGYLTAINKLESVRRGELEQYVRDLQEAIEIEASPFTRYQKIKFRYSILQSYLETLEESITKDVGRYTHNQFEDFFIYLSDAGILAVPFDQMYLRLLTGLGLTPVEARRGAKVKFVPERHQHLRLESPDECTIYTYGVIYRGNIVCRATVA